MADFDLVLATDTVPAANLHADPHRRALRALLPVMADRRVVVAAAYAPSTCLHRMHPVVVSRQTLARHRDGHCANTLVPLYHGRAQRPVFQRSWSEAYRAVNLRYAQVIAGIAAPHGTVWVHDYHLQLVPANLRRLRPDLNVGVFLHTPLPPAELFAQLPSRSEILSGLCQADLLAFQDKRSADNLHHIAAVYGAGPPPSVMTLPMPADTRTISRLAATAGVRARAAQIREALRPADTILLSTGAWDAAEGIAQQLDAYAQLLAQRRLHPRRTALIHLAAGTNDTPAQQHLRADLERRIAQINGAYSHTDHAVIHYLRGDLDPEELTAYYLAADVLLATPVHHGSALSACEFAAVRDDGTGRIILSELTNTAAELPHATAVNPHDTDALARAIENATHNARQPCAEMIRMHDRQGRLSVTDWAEQLLHCLKSTVHRDTNAYAARAPITATPSAHSGKEKATIRPERQTPREPAQHTEAGGLAVAAPHP